MALQRLVAWVIIIITWSNSLSALWYQTITWTNAAILSNSCLQTNFSVILINIWQRNCCLVKVGGMSNVSIKDNYIVRPVSIPPTSPFSLELISYFPPHSHLLIKVCLLSGKSNTLTQWPLKNVILVSNFSNSFYRLKCRALPMKLFTSEYHRSSSMIGPYQFRYWLGAIKQQAIT